MSQNYNFHIASFGSGEMQDDLKGVEIPENPDYAYDESYSYGHDDASNYGYNEADKYNYDYPRTYRMSTEKITEDECSRADLDVSALWALTASVDWATGTISVIFPFLHSYLDL